MHRAARPWCRVQRQSPCGDRVTSERACSIPRLEVSHANSACPRAHGPGPKPHRTVRAIAAASQRGSASAKYAPVGHAQASKLRGDHRVVRKAVKVDERASASGTGRYDRLGRCNRRNGRNEESCNNSGAVKQVASRLISSAPRRISGHLLPARIRSTATLCLPPGLWVIVSACARTDRPAGAC